MFNSTLFILLYDCKRLPFDWRNPTGYLLAIVIEFLVAFCVLSFIACFSTFAFGSFMFALSFAKDLIAEVNSINKCMRTGKSETKILKRFVKSIALHADMKQLSVRVHCSQKAHLNFEHFTCRLIKYFSEIYETTVAVVFFGSIVTICTALSFLQLELVQCLNCFLFQKICSDKKMYDISDNR